MTFCELLIALAYMRFTLSGPNASYTQIAHNPFHAGLSSYFALWK